jgi:hypothetical protein
MRTKTTNGDLTVTFKIKLNLDRYFHYLFEIILNVKLFCLHNKKKFGTNGQKDE